ncbi:DUF3450 domain-containing protein [Hirschia baltica]|uniref:TonB system biopolymer transport component n=1 Tax=Hirschia baltica (strain ATCC 49814 / DSM 5838 / IFAM 1418) TaxID=582402 RepID=C6XI73_HIRBI|nr:DUF3450 domain-containing protein [Hirschia baltica]ACT58899.1 TonB system biopolymer transport component [Hirschia baltica ATCC 49814]
MKRFIKPVRAAFMASILASVATPAFAQADLAGAISVGEAATRKAEQTQERINQLDDERSDMVREFRTLLQQKDAAALYKRQQERVVASQENELKSLEEQLGRVEEIKAQMVPMMEDMIAAAKMFYAADLPFKDMTEDGKLDVRADRYAKLDDVMGRGDVSPAERYRLIIQAFQSEMEYGRTIDAYTDDITLADGSVKTVDIFRYGRVAMVYITKDRNQLGRWDRETQQWVDLPSSYKSEVLKGIRIADKVATPAIMMAPVVKLSAQ